MKRSNKNSISPKVKQGVDDKSELLKTRLADVKAKESSAPADTSSTDVSKAPPVRENISDPASFDSGATDNTTGPKIATISTATGDNPTTTLVDGEGPLSPDFDLYAAILGKELKIVELNFSSDKDPISFSPRYEIVTNMYNEFIKYEPDGKQVLSDICLTLRNAIVDKLMTQSQLKMLALITFQKFYKIVHSVLDNKVEEYVIDGEKYQGVGGQKIVTTASAFNPTQTAKSGRIAGDTAASFAVNAGNVKRFVPTLIPVAQLEVLRLANLARVQAGLGNWLNFRAAPLGNGTRYTVNPNFMLGPLNPIIAAMPELLRILQVMFVNNTNLYEFDSLLTVGASDKYDYMGLNATSLTATGITLFNTSSTSSANQMRNVLAQAEYLAVAGVDIELSCDVISTTTDAKLGLISGTSLNFFQTVAVLYCLSMSSCTRSPELYSLVMSSIYRHLRLSIVNDPLFNRPGALNRRTNFDATWVAVSAGPNAGAPAGVFRSNQEIALMSAYYICRNAEPGAAVAGTVIRTANFGGSVSYPLVGLTPYNGVDLSTRMHYCFLTGLTAVALGTYNMAVPATGAWGANTVGSDGAGNGPANVPLRYYMLLNMFEFLNRVNSPGSWDAGTRGKSSLKSMIINLTECLTNHQDLHGRILARIQYALASAPVVVRCPTANLTVQINVTQATSLLGTTIVDVSVKQTANFSTRTFMLMREIDLFVATCYYTSQVLNQVNPEYDTPLLTKFSDYGSIYKLMAEIQGKFVLPDLAVYNDIEKVNVVGVKNDSPSNSVKVSGLLTLMSELRVLGSKAIVNSFTRADLVNLINSSVAVANGNNYLPITKVAVICSNVCNRLSTALVTDIDVATIVTRGLERRIVVPVPVGDSALAAYFAATPVAGTQLPAVRLRHLYLVSSISESTSIEFEPLIRGSEATQARFYDYLRKQKPFKFSAIYEQAIDPLYINKNEAINIAISNRKRGLVLVGAPEFNFTAANRRDVATSAKTPFVLYEATFNLIQFVSGNTKAI